MIRLCSTDAISCRRVRSSARLLSSPHRRAHAIIREWPHGDELYVFVDDALRWSRLYRGDAGELERGRAQSQALREKGCAL